MILHREDGNAVDQAAMDWKSASITVAGTEGTTDITTETGFEDLFDLVQVAHDIKIEADATTYIRLNSTTNPKVTVDADHAYVDTNAVVNKIYVSTGGAASTITIRIKP